MEYKSSRGKDIYETMKKCEFDKKIVFYTQRVEIVEAYGERRDCADQRIAEFILGCGYLPVPIPNSIEIVKELIENICPNGIVLSGGNSLVKYGGNAPERDAVDRMLIETAIDESIPLYGFCRGMQSILDYFGAELESVKGHVAVRHTVSGEKGSIEVNSYHNQGCIKLPDCCGLTAVMKAEDGVIEKISHNNLLIAGTMWHPERETVICEWDKKLLKSLVEREAD